MLSSFWGRLFEFIIYFLSYNNYYYIRGLPVFFCTLLFRTGYVSLLTPFPSQSGICFLSGVLFVALLFLFPLTLFSPFWINSSASSKACSRRLTEPPPWNLWPSPLKKSPSPSHLAYSSQQITCSPKSFWEGCSYKQLDFFCILGGNLVYSNWLPFALSLMMMFRALVPGFLQRFCFVLRRGFLYFPTDFLLFRALVPGLLQRFCFVLRRGFLYFPTDFLLFRALVPGLLQRFCFVLRRGFLYFPTDFLLFRALVPGLLQQFCFVLFCGAVSYIFRLTSFCSVH